MFADFRGCLGNQEIGLDLLDQRKDYFEGLPKNTRVTKSILILIVYVGITFSSFDSIA